MTSALAFLMNAKQTKSIKPILAILTVLVLSSLYLVRDYSMGTDTIEYVYIFKDLASLNSFNDILYFSLTRGFEIGFCILTYFLMIIFRDPHILFFIYIAMMYSIFTYVFIKTKLNLVLLFGALFSYFIVYYNAFNILRQSVAMSIIILATYFLTQGNTRRFIILVIISSIFFHYSSLICLGFYFIWKFKDILYRLWFVNIAAVVLVSGTILNYITEKYVRYSAYSDKDSVTSNLSATLLLFYTLVFFVSVIAKKIVRYDLRELFVFLSVIYSFFIGLQIFFYFNGFVNQALIRLAFYFMWPVFFIIGILLISIKDIRFRYAVNTVFFTFILVFFVYATSQKGPEVVPFVKDKQFEIF
ncbi:EpsG family protein [Acinetobacter sp. ULE_I057]|uniref:EpsG family protein n=1 Tax=Acinetobacter sp. ULE_I057 TaxID=3373070 RepID=UPI003AF7A5D5